MFRIDSEGATLDNKFTEGDPSLGVPATVVSGDWLNAVQEEIAGFIEYAGLTLNKASSTQLREALIAFFLAGGRATPLVQSIGNTMSATDVTGFTVDSDTTKCKICLYDIERSTDTTTKQEVGVLFISRNARDEAWRVSTMALLDDDSGVDFSVTGSTVAQLQYETDTISGASYTGEMRITSIFEIKK